MLFGTGQLVKQCRLSTILISHKSKRQCLPFRQRSLLFPVMKLSAFPVSRMQFLLFFYFFSDILWFVFFTDFNVFTNIRLRELSIGYSLPQAWLAKTGVIKNAQVSLVGRNLFFFKNNAPYDPDGMLSTSNRLQGVDVFGMPTNRSIGFNLKVNF